MQLVGWKINKHTDISGTAPGAIHAHARCQWSVLEQCMCELRASARSNRGPRSARLQAQQQDEPLTSSNSSRRLTSLAAASVSTTAPIRR